MSLRRSEQKRSAGGPLKDISHRHLVGLARIQNIPSASKVEFSSYMEENHQLRVKCAKIDEIQNCANILMENIEKYKRWNLQLEGKVTDLMKDNEKLRSQVHKGANLKILKEENLRKQGELNNLRKKMQISDNLQLMRMEQEIVNEKQAKQRMISTIETKHKSQLTKLEHQLKLNLNKVEHENQMLRAQIENLVKENSMLKSNLNEAQGEGRKLARQNDRIQQELMRSQDILIQSQDQLNLMNQQYSDLKINTDQRISTLTVQLDRTRAQLEKSLSMQSMLQRMNAQLKNQGAVLILENQDMKVRSLELQEMNLINLTNIKNLQQRIASMTDSNSYFEAKMIDKDMANKQILDDLQRNNLLQRKTISQLQGEILTKRKEIDDLIMIVSKLEADLKVTTSNAAALEQTNENIIMQLREKEQKINVQTAEITAILAKLHELKAIQQESEYLLLSKEGSEQQLYKEKQKVVDLQNLLELERSRLSEMQILKEQLTNELIEKQKINKSWKDGKEQYEKMYAQQKIEIALYKERIAELQKLANDFQRLVHLKQQEKVRLQSEFQFEKSSLLKEGMEQMEQLISGKYDEILKEYKRHYQEKIKTMEDEVKMLKDQIASAEH